MINGIFQKMVSTFSLSINWTCGAISCSFFWTMGSGANPPVPMYLMLLKISGVSGSSTKLCKWNGLMKNIFVWKITKVMNYSFKRRTNRDSPLVQVKSQDAHLFTMGSKHKDCSDAVKISCEKQPLFSWKLYVIT